MYNNIYNKNNSMIAQWGPCLLMSLRFNDENYYIIYVLNYNTELFPIVTGLQWFHYFYGIRSIIFGQCVSMRKFSIYYILYYIDIQQSYRVKLLPIVTWLQWFNELWSIIMCIIISIIIIIQWCYELYGIITINYV